MENDHMSPLVMIIPGLAVAGIYLFLGSMGGVGFIPVVSAIPAVFAAFVMWLLYEKFDRIGFLMSFCAIAVMGAVFVFLCRPVWQQMVMLPYALFINESSDPVDVTLGVMFLMFMLTILVFLTENVLHIHWFMYMFMSWILVVSPVVGMNAGVTTVFLFTAFNMVLWAMYGMSARRLMPTRYHTDERYRERVVLKTGVVMGIAAVFVFSTALMTVRLTGSGLYNVSLAMESGLKNLLASFGIGDNGISGTINRGNVYPLSTRALEIRTSQQPEGSIYLRGFSGGDYESIRGVWEENTDVYIYSAAMRRGALPGDVSGDYIDGIYYQAASDRSETIDMDVVRLEDQSMMFRPYLSVLNENTGLAYDTYSLSFTEMRGPYLEGSRNGAYREFEKVYKGLADTAYTAVPEKGLEGVRGLIDAYDLTGDEDPMIISALIYAILDNNAEYSTRPGFTPVNKDPVEYFLTESHRGYCQHYASAAVLMYRMCGVPARYAAGYVVGPDDFTDNGDGTWRVSVTGAMGHAWPEIFMEGYGWVPIEVTPASYAPDTYPGLDASFLEGLFANGGGIESMKRSKYAFTSDELAPGFGVHAGILLATGVMALSLIISIRKRRRGKVVSKGNALSREYAGYVRNLHDKALGVGYDGSEKGFPSALAVEMSEFEVSDPSDLALCTDAARRAVLNASFGDRDVSKEDRERVRAFGKKVRELIRKSRESKKA
ncbi:MAG: hypothetical protein K6E33_06275 [Lachnospiraceae bacterium]|nr:hypothetical protein [Lachnospiraceae bacterium]